MSIQNEHYFIYTYNLPKSLSLSFLFDIALVIAHTATVAPNAHIAVGATATNPAAKRPFPVSLTSIFLSFVLIFTFI